MKRSLLHLNHKDNKSVVADDEMIPPLSKRQRSESLKAIDTVNVLLALSRASTLSRFPALVKVPVSGLSSSNNKNKKRTTTPPVPTYIIADDASSAEGAGVVNKPRPLQAPTHLLWKPNATNFDKQGDWKACFRPLPRPPRLPSVPAGCKIPK